VQLKSGSIINIDGKAVREAQDPPAGLPVGRQAGRQNKRRKYPVYSTCLSAGRSAFLSGVGISIGQVKVEDKSSEYTCLPCLAGRQAQGNLPKNSGENLIKRW
jgi:hypothetical protein